MAYGMLLHLFEYLLFMGSGNGINGNDSVDLAITIMYFVVNVLHQVLTLGKLVYESDSFILCSFQFVDT